MKKIKKHKKTKNKKHKNTIRQQIITPKQFGTIEDNNLLGQDFFRQSSLGINYLELFMLKSVFESSFELLNLIMDFNKVKNHPNANVITDIYNEYKDLPNIFSKGLEIHTNKLNKGMDYQIININDIAEITPASYKSDKDFSLKIPMSMSLAIPFLAHIYELRTSYLAACKELFEVEAKIQFDTNLQLVYGNLENLYKYENIIRLLSNPFYQKVLTFCDLPLAYLIYKKNPLAKIITDEPTFLEIRII